MAAGNDADETRALWARYKATGDPALRDEIVLRHIHLVRWAVDRVAYGGASAADREDLLSEGIVGLLDAIDRYDPARGIMLSTYATFRIRGQIADALRARDALPRPARQRVRALQEATTRLTASLGRPPEEEEVAQALGVSLAEVRQTLVDASVQVTSLDAQREGDDEGDERSLLATLRAPEGAEPAAQMDEEALVGALREALEALPERLRTMLALYYVEELTMKEVGEVLGVSESRVSQLHGRAVTALRALLGRAGYLAGAPEGQEGQAGAGPRATVPAEPRARGGAALPARRYTAARSAWQPA